MDTANLNLVNLLLDLPASVYWKNLEGMYLGCNRYMLDMVGMHSLNEIIGKTDYELSWRAQADALYLTDQEVISTGLSKNAEEKIRLADGRLLIYSSNKKPLLDDAGNIIGVVGVSIDITKLKENEINSKIAEEKAKQTENEIRGQHRLTNIYLENILKNLPEPIYWLDESGVMLGCNDVEARLFGFSTASEAIGKNIFDFGETLNWEDGVAKALRQNDIEVMQSKTGKRTEESYTSPDGKFKTFISHKAPLFDETGEVIGIIGTSVDITSQKEAERLSVENEAHKTQLQEQEKFAKAVDQVAHDIRSPLASLLMIVKSCQAIPEPQRVALRDAATTISDIANNLLHQYKKKEILDPNAPEKREPLLISVTLLEVLTDKKYQYQALPVRFDHDFNQLGYFSFININLSSFKRMMSNLINNAVDAFEEREGTILVKLEATNDKVKVIIKDDGKGMSDEIANKIMSKVAVTAGKQDGHGLGMVQVRETLEATQGEMDIHSVLGRGTEITLTFPRVAAPHWIAEQINLDPDDLILVLDDDSSIHGAWDIHFASILASEPQLKLKHFDIGQECIDFISQLPAHRKPKVFLLSDYELLGQNLNGLDVISKSGVMRSLLVTSHYANAEVRNRATVLGIKILPKQMASEVPVKIGGVPRIFTSGVISSKSEVVPQKKADVSQEKVDLVIVEDSMSFAESIILYLKEIRGTPEQPYCIDHYTDPRKFLENLSRYPQTTKISLDNDFGLPDINGLKIAEQLHQQGYTQLSLLSGTDFPPEEIPPYLNFILKTDLDKIAQI